MAYGFSKDERSSFSYWFAHWCAFQMVALNCRAWKAKYLLHDWYKPWLRMAMPYSAVQMFHNKRSRHHLLWWFLRSIDCRDADWDAMVIDWECSRFTKQASPLRAADEAKRIIASLKAKDMSNKTVRQLASLGKLPETGADEEAVYQYKIKEAERMLAASLKKLSLE